MDDDVVSFEIFFAGIRVPSCQVGPCFVCVPLRCAAPFFKAVRMAFPLDQGLQLDSLWSSVDLYFEDSLEDHGVSGQLVLDKIALEASVWQRCRPLQFAPTAHQLLRRREGVCAVTGSLLPLSAAGYVAQAMVSLQRFRSLGVR